MLSQTVDLHSHTTASDGSCPPIDLIRLAEKEGIKYIAVTDHDTLEGIEEAEEEGRKHGIQVIAGIELSVNYPGIPGSIHLLGININYKSEKIKQHITTFKEYRKERNLKMFKKLQKLGFKIIPEDFPGISLYNLGRAHIARKMYEKGFVSSVNEAFENFLKKGEKAYVNKKRFSIEEAIALVHSISGIAALAHPYTLKLNNVQLEMFVKYLKENCGLDALEVYYPEHSPRFIDFYLELTRKFSLIPVGGSDFHGDNKPGLRLGHFLHEELKELAPDWESILNQIFSKSEAYEKALA
ncbi:MAG TPA: phosphoesterase [Spirochaetia bacterium]|nr:MAG: hypothetical protein A2Y41_06760 [Spirochaetes bacterium GWB1_36_13]HCL56962.1 phosphoesterase [Spirochaetia bacterium]